MFFRIQRQNNDVNACKRFIRQVNKEDCFQVVGQFPHFKSAYYAHIQDYTVELHFLGVMN